MIKKTTDRNDSRCGKPSPNTSIGGDEPENDKYWNSGPRSFFSFIHLCLWIVFPSSSFEYFRNEYHRWIYILAKYFEPNEFRDDLPTAKMSPMTTTTPYPPAWGMGGVMLVAEPSRVCKVMLCYHKSTQTSLLRQFRNTIRTYFSVREISVLYIRSLFRGRQ